MLTDVTSSLSRCPRRLLTLLLATLLILVSPTSTGRAQPIPVPAGISATHRLPVEGAVLRPADIPDQPWLPGHRGVDLHAFPGQQIVASRGGVVHFAGSVAGTPVVSISHSDDLRTTYEPVIATVGKGVHVKRGQPIGRLADFETLSESARREPGLSWGARVGKDHYIDPMLLLGVPRIVLKS